MIWIVGSLSSQVCMSIEHCKWSNVQFTMLQIQMITLWQHIAGNLISSFSCAFLFYISTLIIYQYVSLEHQDSRGDCGDLLISCLQSDLEKPFRISVMFWSLPDFCLFHQYEAGLQLNEHWKLTKIYSGIHSDLMFSERKKMQRYFYFGLINFLKPVT